MSTIEKLFVQIFDRKRQIIEQLNHQKQLYDQHLASKLLIQGITPPPWLLNFHNFASSSTSSSDPKDLNKEELISELLLPIPQPLPTYANASNLYGKLLSAVSNSEQQRDLVNATSAGCKGLDDCRPGVLPQCLFRSLEDIHHLVAESPQERVVSDIYAVPDESLAQMQRSKSRQKALEIRSSRKVSDKFQLEDKPPTGPSKEDMLKEGSATAAGGILSSSKDDSLLKEQGVSRKEVGDFRCPTNKADSSTNWFSTHSVCRDLPHEESLVAADSVSGKEKLDAYSLGMQKIEVGESASESASTLGLSNLIASQVDNLLPVELLLQDKVVSPQRMQLASVSSEKNELQGDMYSGGTKCDAHSFEGHRVREGEGPADIAVGESASGSASTLGLSNLIASQAVNLLPVELILQDEVVSPQRMRLASVSSEKNELQGDRYSGRTKYDTHSFEVHRVREGECPAEIAIGESASGSASTLGLSNLIASQVVNLLPVELILQDEVVSPQRMQLASVSSEKNELRGDMYSGGTICDTHSFEVHRVQEGEGPAEIATTHALSNEIAGQVVNLCPQERSYQLPVEHPTSASSEGMKLVIGSSGKKKLQKGEREQSPAELEKKSLEDIHQLLAGQPASIPSEIMTLATNLSGENKLEGDKYLGNGSLDTDSPGQLQRSVGHSIVETASAQAFSRVISPSEHQDFVGRSVSGADLESFTFERKCDDTLDTGDLEGLIAIDLPKNTIDRAKFLERLCRSASLGVPLSHFQASNSSDWKMDVCHSVPIGLLENTDLINTSALDHIDGQLLKSSHTYTKRLENSALQGNSFDDYSPIHGTQFAWDFEGPYISPVSKAIEGVSAKSRSSRKRGSSNPELTCFPIEESGEEAEIADDNDHNCPEETGSFRMSLSSASEDYMNIMALDRTSKMVSLGSVSTDSSISASDKQWGSDPEFTCYPVEESSEQDVNVVVPQTCKEKSGSARQPLRDISQNVTALVLHPSPKRSTESFSRASCTSEANKKNSGSSWAQSHQSEILKKRKKNQNVSLSTAGVKKLCESRDTRFSKPKVSGKSSMETRGGSFSEKETKPNNIISNIKSFVPLVQKNQEASRAPVKKEIVKSLQAAVAAKQREEKKENERKQRKEAQELERARREKEKWRQFELQKKAKEEERKKKDAQIADRKRQREEEEERKEKERKRKRVGEARKQLKGHDDKMSVDKEKCRSHAEDGKTGGRKEANTGREETMTGGQEVKKVAMNPVNNPATSHVLPIASRDLNINGLGMSSDPCVKDKDDSVVAGCSTPTDVNYSSTTQIINEKSYDISPYCCSDEEEEDEIPNDKFIPAWASKSSVTKALASLNTFNPEVIFPPSSFCSLNEVLLPRQLKQR